MACATRKRLSGTNKSEPTRYLVGAGFFRKGRKVSTVFVLAAIAMFIAAESFAGEAQPSERDLRAMIGQMILVGFTGNTPAAEGFQTVRQQVADGRISGVLYLGRNIRDMKTVRLMNEILQSAAGQHPAAFIAVDQEGGRIQRLTTAIGFKATPAAAQIGAGFSFAAAKAVYLDLAHALADLKFNVNFGPVVDLNVNPANPIIGRLGRSYSAKPEAVTSYATAFVEAHRSAHIATALKHFPGHGSSTHDTHKGIADVSATWHEEELKPFQAMISAGNADMVMISHVVNRQLVPDGSPASLSPEVITGLLRGRLGFHGVVVSDDLQMAAVTNAFDLDTAVIAAVRAGTDVLVFANDKHPDPAIPEKITSLLVQRATQDPQLRAQIAAAAGRVAKLKARIISQANPIPDSRL